MADAKELLGALLKRGMTDSSQRRIDNSLNEDSLAGILQKEFGATPPRAAAKAKVPHAPGKIPTKTRTATKATVPAGPDHLPTRAPQDSADPGESATGGGLSDFFGKSFKGGAGAAALALLEAIAMKALRARVPAQGSKELDSAPRVAGGPREAGNVKKQQPAQSAADLIVKAMVNAAKADGRVDEDEFQKVVGELQGEGVTQAERDFLLGEVRKPMCTADIVRAVPDLQVGAQVYAASLLAIEVDTSKEKAYLQQLADDLGLDPQIVSQIHATLGVA